MPDQPARHRRAGRWRTRLLLAGAVLSGPVLLLLAAGPAPTAVPATPADPAAPASSATAPDQLARGRVLYGRSCASCHGQEGTGSQRGPSLVDAGAAGAHFQLSTGRMPLADPEAQSERGEPAFGPEDIDALVTYVATLGDGPPIPVVRTGDPQQGRELYLLNCASCHSSNGYGGALPNGLHAPSLEPATPTQIAEATRIGPGAMPRFREGTLSDREVNSIASYIEALETAKAAGGHPLGGIGPVAEGAVAWIAGIGLLLGVIWLLGKRAP